MTNPFTSADIANMVEAQKIHAYVDTVHFIPAPDLNTLDAYGQPTISTLELLVQCAVVDGGKAESWKDADIEVLDGELYLDAFLPNKGDKVKVITRFGQPVTNKTYQIVGVQDRGAFGYVCALKAVTI
jgi:hypothetical protein